MRRALSLSLWIASSCSLLVSAEVQPPRCEQSAECEVLNQIDGIASDAPARWRCAPMERICLLLPRDEDGDGESPVSLGGTDCDDRPGVGALRGRRRAEVGDGVDNNCDGVVDEGVWVSVAREHGATEHPPATLSGAQRSDGVGAALTTAMGRGASVRVIDGALSTSPFGYRSVFTRDEAAVFELGCPRGTPEAPRAEGCDFADLAAAELARPLWVAAALSTHECASGQLYVAAFDESDNALTLDFRTRGRASNLARGVDVASSGPPCSGASAPDAPSGASRPAIAVLREAPDQHARAMVVWHARSAAQGAERCGQRTPVHAMGAWVAPVTDGARRFASAQALQEGRPATLDATSGDARPAVAALPGTTGFAIAYGRADGGVALRVVPPFAAPTAGASTGAALDLSRPPLVLARDASRVDQVVVSAGGVRGARQELGVAWREGCGAEAPLRFARVRLDPANPAASEVSPVTRLSERAALPVAMAYADQGLLQPTETGASAVRVDDDGGWVVVWGEVDAMGTRALAARLSERSGQLLARSGACGAAGVEAPLALGSPASAPLRVVLYRGADDGVGVLRAMSASGARWQSVDVLLRRGGALTPESRCE